MTNRFANIVWCKTTRDKHRFPVCLRNGDQRPVERLSRSALGVRYEGVQKDAVGFLYARFDVRA